MRYLKPGERIPDGEPRRYRSPDGYIRLRWRVGPKEYVEVREHRVRDGFVVEDEVVHHHNGDRADNRRENLVGLSRSEHGQDKHGSPAAEETVRLYRQGLSTVQIGRRLGRDSASVWRLLKRRGVLETRRYPTVRDGVDGDELRRLHDSGLGVEAIARRLGVSTTVVSAVRDALGIKPHRPGRPKAK